MSRERQGSNCNVAKVDNILETEGGDEAFYGDFLDTTEDDEIMSPINTNSLMSQVTPPAAGNRYMSNNELMAHNAALSQQSTPQQPIRSHLIIDDAINYGAPHIQHHMGGQPIQHSKSLESDDFSSNYSGMGGEKQLIADSDLQYNHGKVDLTKTAVQAQLQWLYEQARRLNMFSNTNIATTADHSTDISVDHSELPEFGLSSGESSPVAGDMRLAHRRHTQSTGNMLSKHDVIAEKSLYTTPQDKLLAEERLMQTINFTNLAGVEKILNIDQLLLAKDQIISRAELERKERAAQLALAIPTLEQTDEEKAKKLAARKPLRKTNRIIAVMSILLITYLVEEWIRSLYTQYRSDGNWYRFLILAIMPPSILFLIFGVNIIFISLNNIFGFVNHVQNNSPYYSITPPSRDDDKLNRNRVAVINDDGTVEQRLVVDTLDKKKPMVTVQIPVFKESFRDVLKPTLESVEEACNLYLRQGGQCNIFVNDDGMLLLEPEQQVERMMYYNAHNISWVARPPEGRAGRFKKASNMNYCLSVAQRLKEHIISERAEIITYRDGSIKSMDLTQSDVSQYVGLILNNMAETEGFLGGGNVQIGDYVLLLDCDSRVPADCMLDVVNELEQSPEVAFTEHLTEPMQVVHDYWENCIAHFTKRVYENAVIMSTSGGDMSPLMGHNAFLRMSALEKVALKDEKSGRDVYWSEKHVSEDFDLAVRLYHGGYVGRYICYQKGWTEGVSLTVRDEITRFQKYAFGASEVMFNPFRYWITRGPFGDVLKRLFTAPIGWTTKFNVLAYLGTYFAMALSPALATLNFFLYQYSSIWVEDSRAGEMWESIFIVFSVLAPLANVSQGYRTGKTSFLSEIFKEYLYTFQLMIFFNGLGLHLLFAVGSHLLGLNMTFSATAKEVKLTNFFKELKLTLRTYKWMYLVAFSLVGMIVVFRLVMPIIDPSLTVMELWSIFPLSLILVGHLITPLVLNPVLMRITF